MTPGTQTGLCDRLKGRGGRELWEGGNMDIPMADSW